MTKDDIEIRLECVRLALATAEVKEPKQVVQAARRYWKFICSAR
jgi:hypothetical protein